MKLHSDLARIVVRQDGLPEDTIVNSIVLQANALRLEHGPEQEHRIADKAAAAPHVADFENALERVRNSMPPEVYTQLRSMLGSSVSMADLAASSTPLRQANKEVALCEHVGCTNLGTKLCTACRLVSYCSKECQLAAWKAGHKRQCRKYKGDKDNHSAATQAAMLDAARAKGRPAFRDQEARLAANPSIDYVVILPTGNQDHGAQFTDPMGKLVFRIMRQKALTSPYYVSLLYDQLFSSQGPHS